MRVKFFKTACKLQGVRTFLDYPKKFIRPKSKHALVNEPCEERSHFVGRREVVGNGLKNMATLSTNNFLKRVLFIAGSKRTWFNICICCG